MKITMANQELAVRDDINIFITDDHLQNPELDETNQTLRFSRIDSELPDQGDYLLINPETDAAIFRVKEILSSTTQTVEFKVAAADFGDLMKAGDFNVTIGATNGEDAGFRWNWQDGTLGSLPWADTLEFDCADGFGRDTKINFLDALPSSIVKREAGVEIGCRYTVEIKNNYAFNPNGVATGACALLDVDPFVIKSGSVNVKGSFSVKPYFSLGYSIPISLPTATIWQRENAYEKTVTRVIFIRGIPIPVALTIKARPRLNWNMEATAGQNVDFVTNALVTGKMDSAIEYNRTFLANIPCSPDMLGYNFEYKERFPTRFEFADGKLIGKSTVATEFEVANNFNFGVGISLKHLERLSVSAGANAALVAKGAIEERENQKLFDAPVNATPLELRSLELLIDPSLKATASLKLLDLDLPWWARSLDILYTRRMDLVTIPFPDIPLAATPHLELDFNEVNDSTFNLTASERDDSGLFGLPDDIQMDKIVWHKLDFENEFDLEPSNDTEKPVAEGEWNTEARNVSVALEYLPSIAGDLLDQYPDYLGIMKKYAVYEELDCSPVIMDRYVIKSMRTDPDAPKDCGVVKDIVTGLEWQRCSAGQTWNAATLSCDGNSWARYRPGHWLTLPPYNVPDFMKDVPSGWRLPTAAELRTLVYCSSGVPVHIGMTLDETYCGAGSVIPTIVSQAFPNTPAWGYWTTTPSSIPDGWWAARFDLGLVNGNGYSLMYHMRYVR